MGAIADRLRSVLPKRVNYEELIPHVVVNKPIAVTSDLHVPYIDEDLFEKFIRAIQRYGVDEVWIIGDFTHQDAFSRHPEGLNDGLNEFRDELRVGYETMDVLFEYVDTVRVHPGNHDERLVDLTGAVFGMQELYTLLYPRAAPFIGGVGTFTGDDGRTKQLIVEDLPSMYATIFGEKWFFTHPDQYSKIRGKIANGLAAVHHCNVAVGHTHSWAMVPDDSGLYLCLDLGGLFKPEYFDYVFQKPKNSPRMIPGFFIFSENEVVPFKGRRG